MIDELKEILIGKKIGSGAYRDVYNCRLDSSVVLKIEKEAGTFSNIREWKLWEEIVYGPFEKWFAPCIDISPNGHILIQKKVEPLRKSELPKEVPYFFTDVKPENFGLLNGKFVCCDYGSVPFSRHWTEKRMRAPHWDDFFTANPIK